MNTIKKFILSTVLLGSAALYAHAVTIYFPAGKTETTIKGTISGYDTAQYQLQANAGQYMSANIVKGGNLYVNIYAPGDQPGEAEAIYNSGSDDSLSYIHLPSSGKYTVQVYQMRAQAREGKKVPFSLKISIKDDLNQTSSSLNSNQSVSSSKAKPIQFAKGSSTGSVNGKIKGYQDALYRIRANANQTLSFSINNPNLYLNIYAPGDKPGASEALFNGSESADAQFVLPQSGEYLLQVYQMRNAARQNKSVNFELNVSIE